MKSILCLQIKVKGFFKLILSFQVCVTRHAQIIQNNKFAISLQYLEKEVSDEFDFLHADKHESLLQIDTKILMGMIKHSRSSQNSKFTMSFQQLKKEVRDEVDFLHADKRQSFLQGDTIIIDGYDQAFSKYSNLKINAIECPFPPSSI